MIHHVIFRSSIYQRITDSYFRLSVCHFDACLQVIIRFMRVPMNHFRASVFPTCVFPACPHVPLYTFIHVPIRACHLHVCMITPFIVSSISIYHFPFSYMSLSIYLQICFMHSIYTNIK